MDFIIIGIIIIIPLIADIGVKSSYNKYLKIANKKGMTGQEVARQILDKNGLQDVYVVATDGVLTDHYDPTRKTVRLSKAVYEGTSISSMAIAAHECGHAIQDKEQYTFFKIRSAIVPIVNIGTSISYYIILIGLFLQALNLVYLGIALTSLGLVFQIVTLPVELDASARAKKQIDAMHLATNEEANGVSTMLRSAAMTYVAGVITSAMQIVRLILVTRNRN